MAEEYFLVGHVPHIRLKGKTQLVVLLRTCGSFSRPARYEKKNIKT